MATWDAFQLEETHRQYISLEKIMEVVESVIKKWILRCFSFALAYYSDLKKQKQPFIQSCLEDHLFC